MNDIYEILSLYLRKFIEIFRIFIVISIENVEEIVEISSRKKQGCEEHLGMLEYISCLFGQNVLNCR